MKVIENTLETDWEYTLNCGGCNSKLEITTNDIFYKKTYHSSIWPDEPGWYKGLYFIKCPICKSRVKIEEVYPANSDTDIVPKVFAKRLRNS